MNMNVIYDEYVIPKLQNKDMVLFSNRNKQSSIFDNITNNKFTSKNYASNSRMIRHRNTSK